MVKVPTGLNDLKRKVYDLDICKLKTVPIDLKKLSDVVSNGVAKKIVYNKLNAKVNSLEKNITDASTLIQSNQYNTDKQHLEKKMVMLRTKHQMFWFGNYCCFQYKN